MEKFLSFIATVAYIGALIALVCVPWLLILAAPVILMMSAPVAFAAYLIHRRQRSWKSKLHVLVVDDEPISVSPLLVALNDPKLEVNVVTSSHQMLDELRAKSFDLLFLDRYMPDMDGDKALQVGDLDPELQNQTPVIFFTSSADGLALQEYGKFHVRDVWQKGTPLLELRDRLRSVMTEIVA